MAVPFARQRIRFMPSKTRSTLLIALGIAIGAIISLSLGRAVWAGDASGTRPPAEHSAPAHARADTGKNNGQGLPLAELRTFVTILNEVKQGYVEKVSDKTLLQNAIRGMVDGLDPHSAYLDKAEFRDLSISTSGKFGGLGIKISRQNGFLRVISPIDNTPASRAGITAGDIIVRINGRPVQRMSLIESIKIIRGKPGSKVTLTLLRKGHNKPITLHLTRANIKVKSVKSHLLGPGYGTIRITQFTSQTGAGVKKAMTKLQKKSSGLKGLVLDLRNNPGGVLSAAVDVADAFIDHGKIVSIKGRAPHTDKQFDAAPGDALAGVPMVVLVNQGSASAAEIVAGALQDDQRAVIMGHRTFGKGSVQTVIPLKSGAALKLTTARYYTPSGHSIQDEGIEPDVPIQPVKITPKKNPGTLAFSEADLAGALKNNTETRGERTSIKAEKAHQAKQVKLAEQDYGLYEALNLLKGLHILQQHERADNHANHASTSARHSHADSR
jgi:carboxyl-terminal processing protease